MANLISTDSGHHYDLDDIQSGLRYIVEQRLGAQPGHVLSLVYNAIEHIERQKLTIDAMRKCIAPNSSISGKPPLPQSDGQPPIDGIGAESDTP
jgi:hypothetical protein